MSTTEDIAKEYINKQLAVMRKYGSLTREIQQPEYDEIVAKIAAIISSSATKG